MGKDKNFQKFGLFHKKAGNLINKKSSNFLNLLSQDLSKGNFKKSIINLNIII